MSDVCSIAKGAVLFNVVSMSKEGNLPMGSFILRDKTVAAQVRVLEKLMSRGNVRPEVWSSDDYPKGKAEFDRVLKCPGMLDFGHWTRRISQTLDQYCGPHFARLNRKLSECVQVIDASSELDVTVRMRRLMSGRCLYRTPECEVG